MVVQFYEKKCHYNNEYEIIKIERNFAEHAVYDVEALPMIGDIILLKQEKIPYVVKRKIFPFTDFRYVVLEVEEYKGEILVTQMEEDVWYPDWVKRK